MIIQLQNYQKANEQLDKYAIERFKSFGDQSIYEITQKIQIMNNVHKQYMLNKYHEHKQEQDKLCQKQGGPIPFYCLKIKNMLKGKEEKITMILNFTFQHDGFFYDGQKVVYNQPFIQFTGYENTEQLIQKSIKTLKLQQNIYTKAEKGDLTIRNAIQQVILNQDPKYTHQIQIKDKFFLKDKDNKFVQVKNTTIDFIKDYLELFQIFTFELE